MQLTFFEDDKPLPALPEVASRGVPAEEQNAGEDAPLPPAVPSLSTEKQEIPTARKVGAPDQRHLQLAGDQLKKQFGINPELPGWSALVWHKAHELAGNIKPTVDDLIAAAANRPRRNDVKE